MEGLRACCERELKIHLGFMGKTGLSPSEWGGKKKRKKPKQKNNKKINMRSIQLDLLNIHMSV